MRGDESTSSNKADFKSSAIQRTGRAGRVSAGHCVRLFDFNLSDPSSKPEIHRSSLDLVVLRVASLNIPVASFLRSFVDTPDPDSLQHSVATLRNLGCLDGKSCITPKGREFFKMPFDPRWTEFIVKAAQYGATLHDAVAVAAIQCAPGSIYFIGTAEAKMRRRKELARAASEFTGDIRMQLHFFDMWHNAGLCDSRGICKTCKRRAPRGCQACRKAIASKEGLNNKVLDIVLKTIDTAKEILTRDTRLLPQRPKAVAPPDCLWIGAALYHVFPEQLCLFAFPDAPEEGVIQASSKSPARIQELSIFKQNVKDRPQTAYAIAVKAITIHSKLTGEITIVETLEGVKLTSPPNLELISHVEPCLGFIFQPVIAAPEFHTMPVLLRFSNNTIQITAEKCRRTEFEGAVATLRTLLGQIRTNIANVHVPMFDGRLLVEIGEGEELKNVVVGTGADVAVRIGNVPQKKEEREAFIRSLIKRCGIDPIADLRQECSYNERNETLYVPFKLAACAAQKRPALSAVGEAVCGQTDAVPVSVKWHTLTTDERGQFLTETLHATDIHCTIVVRGRISDELWTRLAARFAPSATISTSPKCTFLNGVPYSSATALVAELENQGSSALRIR